MPPDSAFETSKMPGSQGMVKWQSMPLDERTGCIIKRPCTCCLNERELKEERPCGSNALVIAVALALAYYYMCL
jgi:hypothetical protein